MAGWMAYTAGLRASRQWGGTQAAQHQFLRAPTFTLCATVVHKTCPDHGGGGQRPLGSSREAGRRQFFRRPTGLVLHIATGQAGSVSAFRHLSWRGAAERDCSDTMTLPEHIEMPMPRLVPTMQEGIIAKWLVSEGDYVDNAELVCEIIADISPEMPAATLLIESHEAGFLAKKLRCEGEMVQVDLPIAVFCDEESHVPAFKDYCASAGVSPNSSEGSGDGEGRLFCWQAYLKEDKLDEEELSELLKELKK